MPLSRPATALADAAAALSAEACPPFLDGHNHRTFHFGMLFVDRRAIDAEATFIASMLHDLGLTEAHRADRGFDEVGADLACRFLEGRGWALDRIRLVEQAILRHTRLEANEAPEHRRDGFGRRMAPLVLDEIARHPEGAFAELETSIGLSSLLTRHPADAS